MRWVCAEARKDDEREQETVSVPRGRARRNWRRDPDRAKFVPDGFVRQFNHRSPDQKGSFAAASRLSHHTGLL
jgi:hypothetical protein